MTARGKNRYDPDTDAELDEELAVLVRALDDLDAERERGELSRASYDRLHAQYTARTAQAVRERTRNTSRRTVAARPGLARRAAIAVAVVLTGSVAAAALLAGAHHRASGQTITGNSPSDPGLQAAVHANPNSPAGHDALAASLMQSGQYAAALQEFDKAARLNPRDSVALTYSGWIAYLAGSPEKALPRLEQAVAADDTYPDAHAFLGIVRLRAGNDRATARAELRRYLALVPSGQMSLQVKAVLAQAAEPGK